jgi:DNA invertase Pin-like site-specific DNA recombinase
MARIRSGETSCVKSPAADGPSVWRIAVYIRLSKEEKKEDTETGSESVINQRKILAEYLEKSFGGNYSVTDYYVDDGLSGTDRKSVV